MANPHLIEIDEAVKQVKRACDSNDKNQLSPFFFMVGAGISIPSVPRASEIVSHCKQKAEKHLRRDEPSDKSPIDLYSYWFREAYNQPDQRSDYLCSLIELKPITRANFRLAHLLLEDKISNVAVTTNFDDFLTRALNLFGRTYIVCDHPYAAYRIRHTKSNLQIVHLHGTYKFYDCCNLRDELEARAQQSTQTTATMASLLSNLLWTRSPLIIGYSGWEGDVFMDALRRRLTTPLGNNVYWFCYRRSFVDSMPDWLKKNPNVVFVVPKEQPIRKADVDAIMPEPAMKPHETDKRIVAKGPSSTEDEPSLPADMVFAKLIDAFHLQAPQLTKDPIGFFAKQLDDSFPTDDVIDPDTDIYAFKNVIERVRKAKLSETDQSEPGTFLPPELSLEPVRDALRRADYRQAIRLAGRVPFNQLSEQHLNELSDAMWSAGFGIDDNSEEQISAYDHVVVINDSLPDGKTAEGLALRERAANALFNKAAILGALDRSEEAITVYDEIVKRFGEASEPVLRVQVARALLNKGFRLGALNRGEEAITTYDEVVNRSGESDEPGLREMVARALFNKAVTLGALNQSEEEVAVYDEVVKKFGESDWPALCEQVALSLFNKGARLGVLNRTEEEVTAYDEVVERFGESDEPPLRELVAIALFNKGIALGVLNRTEEEVTVYDEVVNRFGESDEPGLRGQVARALVNKGIKLGALSRNEEAILAYDEVLKRFGECNEPAFGEQVARALFNKGLRLKALDRSEEEVAVYDEVVERFGQSDEPALRQQVAMALVEKGDRLTVLNRREEAILVYEDVVKRFGASDEPTLQEHVALALLNKGVRLGALNRRDEAIAVHEEFVECFGEMMHPPLPMFFVATLISLGFQLLVRAKAFRLANNERLSNQSLERAQHRLLTALERDPENPIALGNQAYVAFLLGEKDNARDFLMRAIALGGEAIRNAELEDAKINRLPEDEEFCEMVSSIPASSLQT